MCVCIYALWPDERNFSVCVTQNGYSFRDDVISFSRGNFGGDAWRVVFSMWGSSNHKMQKRFVFDLVNLCGCPLWVCVYTSASSTIVHHL